MPPIPAFALRAGPSKSWVLYAQRALKSSLGKATCHDQIHLGGIRCTGEVSRQTDRRLINPGHTARWRIGVWTRYTLPDGAASRLTPDGHGLGGRTAHCQERSTGVTSAPDY